MRSPCGSLVVYIGPFHQARFDGVKEQVFVYAKEAHQLANKHFSIGEEQASSTLAVLESGEALLLLRGIYDGSTGEQIVNGENESGDGKVALFNALRVACENVKVMVILADFEEESRETVNAWITHIMNQHQGSVRICILVTSESGKLAEKLASTSTERSAISFWKSSIPGGCMSGAFRALRRPKHDFMLHWIRWMQGLHDLHSCEETEYRDIFQKAKQAFELEPLENSAKSIMASSSGSSDKNYVHRVNVGENGSSSDKTAVSEAYCAPVVLMDTINFLVDPADISASVNFYEDGDQAVGIPQVVYSNPRNPKFRLTRNSTSNHDSMQHHGNKLSKHLETYRCKALAAVRELHDQLQAHVSAHETDGFFDEDYWRVATVYQTGKLLGWIVHLESFFVGRKLSGIMYSFFQKEATQEIKDHFGECNNPSCLLSEQGSHKVATCVGEAMTLGWKIPAQVLPYIKFKRYFQKGDQTLLRTVFEPLSAKLLKDPEGIGRLETLLRQHFFS